MGRIKRGSARIAAAAAVCSLLCAFASQAGTWELQEDGKRWMYMDSPGEPVEDEWITEDGKEYYVDSKGYMRTGWVTDQDTKKRYYMGEDGAKCFNTFTPDNHYVGPDGTTLESFDTYRKQVTKGLEAFLKKGSFAEGETGGFLLEDLNGDNYLDIAVFDSLTQPKRVLQVSVWSTEEEKLLEVARLDPDADEQSFLSRSPADDKVWLTIIEADGVRNYFFMESGGSRFVNEWSLETDRDDWDEPSYYVDGAETDLEDWDDIMHMAENLKGDSLAINLHPVDKEHISQTVNRAPTEDELYLWE